LLFAQGEKEILSGLIVMVNGQTFTGSTLNEQDLPRRGGDQVNLIYFLSGG
jgi:hypothetical protein